MNRTFSALVIASLFVLPGCLIVHPRMTPSRGKSTRSASTVQCAPNQTWDGEQCRHKGKGHGARKHDD